MDWLSACFFLRIAWFFFFGLKRHGLFSWNINQKTQISSLNQQLSLFGNECIVNILWICKDVSNYSMRELELKENLDFAYFEICLKVGVGLIRIFYAAFWAVDVSFFNNCQKSSSYKFHYFSLVPYLFIFFICICLFYLSIFFNQFFFS